MKNLYIVGAGGLGRELLNIILSIHEITGQKWNIMGFLDDTDNPLKNKECGYHVVGKVTEYTPKENDVLAMGIADPKAKENLAKKLLERGAKFTSIIHPYVNLGRFCSLGEGAVVFGGFGMSIHCKIGNFATINYGSLGHDGVVGDYCTFSPGFNISGNVAIGDRVFLGANTVIAPHIRIGDDAYLCAGSVILKDVPCKAKMLGNPAKEVG